MKICSKTHQIAPFKNIFSGKYLSPRLPKSCPPPLGKSWIRPWIYNTICEQNVYMPTTFYLRKLAAILAKKYY